MVRIAAVSYLNTLPFIYGLKHSRLIDTIDLDLDYPAACAKKLINGDVDLALVPVVVIPRARLKVKNLIYPVPNPEFPFLGVHFTRMTNGDVECGPNAVFTFKREGYSKTAFSIKDSVQALSFSGTRKLFINHWKFGLNEYRRAFSKRLFLKELR